MESTIIARCGGDGGDDTTHCVITLLMRNSEPMNSTSIPNHKYTMQPRSSYFPSNVLTGSGIKRNGVLSKLSTTNV
jgi:hypothetical protein